MKRRPLASVRRAKLGESGFDERQVEALTVAMIVAPGVYVRNRMFDLFAKTGARHAKKRAAVVRGVVAQLGRASAVSLTTEPRGAESVFVLRYGIVAMRLTRVVELSAAELAALRLVAERANLRVLPCAEDDREVVARALADLLVSPSSDPSAVEDVRRIARDISVPPASS
jgi:hypothetical protein